MDPGDTLQDLYPFLHGGRTDEAALERALLESVRQKAQDSVDTKARFFEHNAAGVVAVAHAVADIYRRGGRLFAMGNGGSSCDAAHIAVEFLHPVTAGRPALAVQNLVADSAMMSAVGNDIGYAHVFVRQLIALARPGDGLIGISTSGNSDNLLAAFAKAREMGLVTIGLSGHDGGKMAASGLLDHSLVVDSPSIHRIQETHVAIYHIIWDLTHTLLAGERGGLSRNAP
ncbi:MAG: SIS domain-containing protein [Rhodocyclaceae bacterium]|nr:SIS domain-containing protein [Rhodocyclaceae bacterium]MBX3668036.1 SIS domain-containing protein [Rhodocyclaceae bacterium]